ncbi:MAG: hypothetical protein WB822_18490, partial [Rhodoplanes sp.]
MSKQRNCILDDDKVYEVQDLVGDDPQQQEAIDTIYRILQCDSSRKRAFIARTLIRYMQVYDAHCLILNEPSLREWKKAVIKTAVKLDKILTDYPRRMFDNDDSGVFDFVG